MFVQRPSLSKDYLLFSGIVLCVVFLLCAWISWSVYTSQVAKRNHQLEQEAQKIDSLMTESFDYIAYLMSFISSQVFKHGSDIHYIKELYGGLGDDKKLQNLPSSSMFDWITPDMQLRLTSTNGVLEKPIDMSDRQNIKDAIAQPGQLFFNITTSGKITHSPIIPVAQGVVDATNKVAGVINIGITTVGLTNKIVRTLGKEGLPFVVLQKDSMDVVLSSPHYREMAEEEVFKRFKSRVSHIASGFVDSAHPIKDGNITYSHMIQSRKYPYIVVVGYDTAATYQELGRTLLLQMIPLILVGIVFIVVLYEFRKHIISPMVNLSKIADDIAKGKMISSVPYPELEHSVYEIANLSSQLVRIQNYIQEIFSIKTALREAKEEAEAARELAEKANRAKSYFLAHMSHELRTPLNAVINMSELILMGVHGPLTDKQKEYLYDIENAGKHLLSLINDILDFSKAEASKMDLNEEDVNISRVIAESHTLMDEMASRKGITLSYSQQNPPFPQLYGDERRLKQVLLNVLSNALKFTPKGGSVTTELVLEEDALVIYVRDTGIGISEEDLPRIFEEYGQAASPYQRYDEQGSGLGIPLSCRLTELHQGTFKISSAQGKGTTVCITFPKERLRYASDDQETEESR